jgi:hypothetical protein
MDILISFLPARSEVVASCNAMAICTDMMNPDLPGRPLRFMAISSRSWGRLREKGGNVRKKSKEKKIPGRGKNLPLHIPAYGLSGKNSHSGRFMIRYSDPGSSHRENPRRPGHFFRPGGTG